MLSDRRLVLLATRGESTTIVYNFLAEQFGVTRVILENRVPRSQFLRRRVKKLGLLTVAGQVGFVSLVRPILERESCSRVAEIKQTFRLNDAPIPETEITRVSSVNTPDTAALLHDLHPDVVVINGTRIISKRTLESVPVPFINIHAGITPLYRGVHGAYWALVERNRKACGVTVHRVDTGIDTGGILGQALIEPSREDNFVSYPLLQLASALPLLKTAIEGVLNGTATTLPPPRGVSRLWSHPTLWGYFGNRLVHGVR